MTPTYPEIFLVKIVTTPYGTELPVFGPLFVQIRRQSSFLAVKFQLRKEYRENRKQHMMMKIECAMASNRVVTKDVDKDKKGVKIHAYASEIKMLTKHKWLYRETTLLHEGRA